MEIFDREIAREIAKALGTPRSIIRDKFTYAMKAIREAKSIEEVMIAKQDLMSSIVMILPTQDDTCYFCEYYNYAEDQSRCEHCSYGKVHGRCSKGGSTWKNLTTMKYDLVKYINKNYWTGGELENAEHQRHQDRQVEDTGLGKA
jgi:hypothetical protein